MTVPPRCDADITRLLDRGWSHDRVAEHGAYRGTKKSPAWTYEDVVRVARAAGRPEPEPQPPLAPDPEPDVPRRVVLSPRMAQVLDGLRQGLTLAQIGDELGLTVHTVKTHVLRLCARLGAWDRSHAIALADSGDLAVVVEEPGGRRRPWTPAPLPHGAPSPPTCTWLTAAEVARELRISTMTVYRLAEAGELRHIRVGRSLRIERGWLNEWIEAQIGP